VTLVDTSCWIHYLRRDGDIETKTKVRGLLLDGAAVLCPVVLAELWMGAGSKKDQAELAELAAVLRCLPMTEDVWECSFRLARICRAKGTPVPGTDLLIVACAFIHGVQVIAKDKHFETLGKYRALCFGGEATED
jgi:predicted nucleic acid-binding protein